MSLAGIPAHLLAQAAADPRNSHAAQSLLRAASQAPSLCAPSPRDEGAQGATGRGNKKASDAMILAAYKAGGSVWRAAELLGMCGQSVHERLVKLGVALKGRKYSTEEDEQIVRFYETQFTSGDGTFDVFCASLGRPKTSVCRRARALGLTTLKRPSCEGAKVVMGYRATRRIAENGHPRGMLGKCHTPEVRARIGIQSARVWRETPPEAQAAQVLKRLKTRERNGTLNPHRHGVTWKGGWREIGGQRCYFRSRWEANYARYLETLRIGGAISRWEHEPETFWFESIRRGARSYLPDFRVTLPDGEVEYHEVKGWMDARSVTKLRRMAKYYPSVVLVVRDSSWFKANGGLKYTIPGWECGRKR